MKGSIPQKKNLGFLPTPVHYLKNLSKYLNGPQIFIKRDDLTGLALGGNKVRKLEYLIGEAIQNEYDTLITGGAVQSNHCRQTAAAASACGLECHLVLGGVEPTISEGNLLLDKLFGAVIHWTGEFRKGEKIPEIKEELIRLGKKPYEIPYGGSNPLGAFGFVEATDEIKKQLENHNANVTHIVFPSSSGGTHAGLIVGKDKYNFNAELIGIQIDKGDEEEKAFEETLLNLTNFTSQFCGSNRKYKSDEIILKKDYLGDGYGVVNNLDLEAIKITASLEGILLDPVYTGRAMGGLIDLIKKNYFTRDDSVLFWHTGGTPALFPYTEQLNIT